MFYPLDARTSPRGGDVHSMLGRERYLQRADFAFTNGPDVQNARVCAEMEFAFCAWRQEHERARTCRWRNWVNVQPEASLKFKYASPRISSSSCEHVLFTSQSLPKLFLPNGHLFAIYFHYMHDRKVFWQCVKYNIRRKKLNSTILILEFKSIINII